MMTLEEAKEIMKDLEECENRKNACKWFCEICEYGQHSRKEVDEAIRIMEELTMTKNDVVNHPAHYAGHCSGECIEYIRLIIGDEGTFAFCIGSIVGYLWRYEFKNRMQDLEKASWYLEYAKKMNDEYKGYLDSNNQLANLSNMTERYKKKLEGDLND